MTPRELARRYGVGLAFAALVLISAVLVRGFASVGNLTTVLLHVSVNAILALGMTFVIVGGGIDLSVGSVVGVAGVLTAATLTAQSTLGTLGVAGATVAAIAVGLASGAAIGAVNGGLTAYLRVAPFVVTLATMTVARGLAR